MDGSKDPFSDHSKKMEQSTPVKRPRQKRLQFVFPTMQQRGNSSGDLTRQMPDGGVGPCQDMNLHVGEIPRWYNEIPQQQYPRRGTPVPDAETEGLLQSEDELWDEIQSLLEVPPPEELHKTGHQQPTVQSMDPAMTQGLHPWANKRLQRPNPPLNRIERVPGMMTNNCSFLNEAHDDRQETSPFSTNRSERARFLNLMTPHHPPVFDGIQRHGGHTSVDMLHVDAMRKNPPPSPQRQGRMVKEEDMYDDFPTPFTPREWGNAFMNTNSVGSVAGSSTSVNQPTKIHSPPVGFDYNAAAAAAAQGRQPRRPRMPGGPTREPELSAFCTRQNHLFDPGYQDLNAERGPGRISAMKERQRRFENRQSPLEETREQENRAAIERQRVRQSIRERRSPCRGNDFGVLMSALGLVPDEDVSGNFREPNSGFSRVREAMLGFMNSRLPPHLLFSDRDFDGDDYEFLCRLDDTVESKKGADERIINRINLCSFTPEHSSLMRTEDEPRCPICLENFASGVEIRVMPCQHKYHRCCLDKWLKIKAVCPICNMNIKDKFHEENTPNHS